MINILTGSYMLALGALVLVANFRLMPILLNSSETCKQITSFGLNQTACSVDSFDYFSLEGVECHVDEKLYFSLTDVECKTKEKDDIRRSLLDKLRCHDSKTDGSHFLLADLMCHKQ